MLPMIEERHKGTPMVSIPNLLTNGECVYQVRTRCGGGVKLRYVQVKMVFLKIGNIIYF